MEVGDQPHALTVFAPEKEKKDLLPLHGVGHDFSIAQSLYLLHFSGTAMLVKSTVIPRSSGLMGRGVVWITRESVV